MTENKYSRCYYRLMERAHGRERAPGTERHHILPCSLGGTNAKDNLVLLTYREHFLAHWLLTKFALGSELRKMRHALGCMRRNRVLNSWQFAIAKGAHIAARLGVKRSPETVAKMMSTRGVYSAETRAKIGAASRGRKYGPEVREKVRAALIGRPVSAATRDKIGAANRNPSAETLAKMRARRTSEQTRAKLSEVARNRSLEVRANISAGQIGKIVSAETRAKIAESNRKREVTDATRAKMRQSQLAAWARGRHA